MTLPTQQDDFTPWTVVSPGAHLINRAAAILRVLAVRGSRGASISEIASATSLPSSTVHRLVSALVDERLAERVRGSRLYRLGMEVIALGAAAGAKHDLRSLARPMLERISKRFQHPTHLLVRTGYDVVCLDQVLPPDGAPTIGGIGSRAPLGVSASGLALLAFLNEDEINDAMQHNRGRLEGNPAFSVDHILANLATIRRRGYAVSRVERSPRIFGLAVPVIGSDRRPLAGLGITTMTGAPLPDDVLKPLALALQDEAARVARAYEAHHEVSQEGWREAGRTELAPTVERRPDERLPL